MIKLDKIKNLFSIANQIMSILSSLRILSISFYLLQTINLCYSDVVKYLKGVFIYAGIK